MKRKIFMILILAIVGNLFIGYLTGLIAFTQVYGLEAPKHFKEGLFHPGDSLISLIFGSNNPAWEKAHELYWSAPLQLIFWGIVLLILLKNLFLAMSTRPTKEEASEYGSHGTSRWATSEEIKEWLMKDDSGIVLGLHQGNRAIHPVNSHLNQLVVVFGGAGTGKSSGLVIPNVLHIAETTGESLIITDPKGEIYNATVPTLRSKGYEIKVFNLLDMKRSHRYNPMDYVNDANDASSLATVIIQNTSDQNRKGNDDFWERAENSLLSALILYVKEVLPKEKQNLRSVLEIGLSVGDDPEAVDELFRKLPSDSEARMAYRVFDQSEDKLRSSILTGFGVRLKLWTSKEVVSLTSQTEIHLEEFGDPGKKIALFIMSRTYDPTYDALPAILIDQAFQVLYKKAERLPGNRLASSVRLILDELANIAPVRGLSRKVATMRGYNISTFLIFQSKSQFEERYGRETASEILDSCDTRLLLGTNDFQTQEYFSKLLGSTTIRVDSISETASDRGSSLGRNRSFIERRLMTPDEVGRLDPNKLIVFQRGRYPMLLEKNLCFQWKDWDRIPKTHWVEELKIRDEHVISLDKIKRKKVSVADFDF